MKPAIWLRATFCASVFACVVAGGAVYVLTGRLDALRVNLDALRGKLDASRALTASRSDLDLLRRGIDRLSDEIRLSSPADLGHKHDAVRDFVIRSKLAQVKNPIVFVGDSITESAFFPASLCGHPVVNAGLGGARAHSYLNSSASVLSAQAALIVVALGTNDSQIASRKGGPFVEFYSDLIGRLKPHSQALVLVGIPPLEMSGALASGYFDKAAAEENDRTIRHAAATNSLPFADVRSTMTGDKLTVDGVHLTPDGYEKWMTAVLPAVRKALDCQAEAN